MIGIVIDDILREMQKDCKKIWVEFDLQKLYWSLDRDTQLSIDSRNITVKDGEIGDYELPKKFGVYRDYLGWWIVWELQQSEVDEVENKKVRKKLEIALDNFQNALEKIEMEYFTTTTERWTGRFIDWIRVN